MTTRENKNGNGGIDIGELPELHIVRLNDLLLHELPDRDRVSRLVDRLAAQGRLKHPLVAATDPGGRLLLLDGANRWTALAELNCSHALVQVIDMLHPALVLDTWHHAVEHIDPDEFMNRVDAMSGVASCNGETARLNGRATLAHVRFKDGTNSHLSGASDLHERVEQLHELTRTYHGPAGFDRVSYTNIDHLLKHYEKFSMLLSFPAFTVQQLLELTERDVRLPSGVTRVLLPKRALLFNLPLEVLRAEHDDGDRDAWLQHEIRKKVGGRAIRFYGEPTFFFDE